MRKNRAISHFPRRLLPAASRVSRGDVGRGFLALAILFGAQQLHAQPRAADRLPIASDESKPVRSVSLPRDLFAWRGSQWGESGPWAGKKPYAPRPKPAGWIDPEPSRWPWTGERDPYDEADRGERRCAEVPVDVTAESSDERDLVCSAANDTLRLLGRCKISLQSPLHVQVASEVRHPFGGPIFGFFDTKQKRALVTQYANIASLVEGTPYTELPRREFYKSLIVHEIIHGVMHQNLRRPATSHAAYEYPAYALQIKSLPSTVRERFLQSVNHEEVGADALFNDSILFFDPFFFAARAYRHFKASADGCAHLHALLEGRAPFILESPSR